MLTRSLRPHSHRVSNESPFGELVFGYADICLDASSRQNAELQLSQAAEADFVSASFPKLVPLLGIPIRFLTVFF